MPPNNSESRKSNEAVDVSLALGKCHSKAEASFGKLHSNGIAHSKSQTSVKTAGEGVGGPGGGVPQRNRSVCSLMDELLCDIYGKMEVTRRTSATTCDLSWQDSDHSQCPRTEPRSSLHWKSKDLAALKIEKTRLEKLIAEEGSNLVKQLKRKNFLLMRREAHYDIITAYIQAVSTKTREDTKMKFSLTPGAETGFSQWLDAMKMVAQLPGGMPSEFRTKLWLQLSEKHLTDQNVDWEKAEAVIFNEWTNPDDEELGVQIVKDLHRTGCSLFCGEQEHNQALLKRVLLAYARWNKNVGYCQGFNMLAALILQVMDKDEKNAVKVMIYLIEGVLPESYFANNLRGLSVDMAVFRDLLRLRLPKLSKHLEALQHDTNAGTSYEPPLTNVFTMQWFLTLFSNCLPQQTVLRVWDLVFLYGNEVLLRTALAIWGVLQDRVITVESADEFYSIMGVVTREMLEFGLMDANALVKMIAMVDPFPNELQELRDKYLYNISPWTQSVHSAAKKGIRLFYSDPDDQDDTEDEDKIALATAYGVFRRRESTSRELQISGPTLDISMLKQQYAKLRQRQRQAHVIITAACSSNLTGNLTAGPSVSVNHLLMGKSALINKGRRIGPPEGSIPPPSGKKDPGLSPRRSAKSGTTPRGDVKEEEKKTKVETSGETFYWKDERRGRRESKSNNNALEEENKTKTNRERTDVTEKKVEESLIQKESCWSSSSSTSTELCDEDSDSGSEDPLEIPDNGGCDKNNLKQIKTLAINLVNEIEEKIQASGKLKGGQSPSRENFDNTNHLVFDPDLQIRCDNILKPEPEVPTCDYVIPEARSPKEEGESHNGRNPKEEREGDRGKSRRKSDLALSVIKENLEMLRKYSQKGVEGCERKTEENNKTADMMWFDERKPVAVRKEVMLEISKQMETHPKTETRENPERASENLFVEKAISPIVEKPSKTVKVNKEVNTELTFGVDEVEISTRQSKLRVEEPGYKLEESVPTCNRKSRETTFREKDEIKQRIETSKSDWELKMKKIAELETTTRETLNEIQARSANRKSLHRSLDRNTRRSHFDREFCFTQNSLLPQIHLESSNSGGEPSNRKLKISALSFDEITSRTEKLLGTGDAARAGDESPYKRGLSPDPETRKPKDSTAKFKKLIEESFGDDSPRPFRFTSSPTSPTRSCSRYGDYLCPRSTGESTGRRQDDLIRATESESQLFQRKYCPESRKPEQEVEHRSTFNPFPTRSASRPKELGVRLGLYPTSPESQSKKS